jgi:hypothetical protein
MNAPRSKGPAATTRPARLAQAASEAAELRAYQTHPDVVALRVEQVRTQVDRLCWAGIVLGLAFTMTNVQGFAAGDAAPWSLVWCAAWLLDPMVSLVLLAVLRAEQVTARYQVPTSHTVRRAKWFTLGATYVMNTWSSWAAGSPAAIVLHSVPPLVVFVAVEAITDVRAQLTEAVSVAFMNAAGVRGERRERRTTFTQYLDAARAAWRPGVRITPAWVRQTVDCSRGLSPKVAAALRAELDGDA